MLGQTIADPDGIEGAPETVDGLGLLNIDTCMTSDKTLTNVTGRHPASGTTINGYEIHIGETTGPDTTHPWLDINGPHGAASGTVRGCYIHGLFTGDSFRAAFLAELGAETSGINHSQTIEDTLDALADHLETHLDVDAIIAIARAGV